MPAGGAIRSGRIAIVVVLALLLAAQVVRNAAAADHERRPGLALALWESHPSVLTDKVLLDVAKAASRGHEVAPATRTDVHRIAAKAPLSPDPFLIEGAIAQTEGRRAVAERLLLAARDRDPRSRGARFLLADHYLRTGRVTDALVEIQVLVGLHSHGSEPYMPMLVAYAQTPGAVAHLRPFLRKFPGLEAGLLSHLAVDARNAELVLALASIRKPDPDWRVYLLAALVADGQYRKAHSTWLRLVGGRSRGLFNPRFRVSDAPPPFNWGFPQTPEGVAEPDGKGGLELLYYGRAKAILASQLMLLPPGAHQLSHTVADASGDAAGIHWIVRCAKPDSVLADAPLRSGPTTVAFAVPNGCEAVWLELTGVAGDTPQTVGVTIRSLNLGREMKR